MIGIIIGMAIVTAIPRFLPALIVDKWSYPPWVSKWLNAIPYAALGALIFPGILSVAPEKPYIGFLAAIISVILAFFRINIIFVVLAAIATVFILTI